MSRKKKKKFCFISPLIFRIYEDAQVNLTKLFTTNKPDEEITRSAQGDALQNLLDLHPSDTVFYVGGYPDNFTVSVFTACHECYIQYVELFVFSELK